MRPSIEPFVGSIKRFASALAVAAAMAPATVALAPLASHPVYADGSGLSLLSTDPYTNPGSQHQTEVEPDIAAAGDTIVATFQAGRYFDAAASNLGFATSHDAGHHWIRGFLPGTTVDAAPAGPFARISDPTVTRVVSHDDTAGAWLIAGLALSTLTDTTVVVSRSADNGATWHLPVTVARSTATTILDEPRVVCDSQPLSHFEGNCYVQVTSVDLTTGAFTTEMTRSTDGGVTWSPLVAVVNNQTPIAAGGQPVVQANGTVVVPLVGGTPPLNLTNILTFRSTDGGVHWSEMSVAAPAQFHFPAAFVRSVPVPTVRTDAGGRVVVIWPDCSFEAGCSANDMVMTSSLDGVTWTPVQRIPIDPVGSGIDHMTPGVAVDPTTAGDHAHLALAYYDMVASCSAATCGLDAAMITSEDGGRSWDHAVRLAGPIQLDWLAQTAGGAMIGDYISACYSRGQPFPALEVAGPPTGSVLHEASYTLQPEE